MIVFLVAEFSLKRTVIRGSGALKIKAPLINCNVVLKWVNNVSRVIICFSNLLSRSLFFFLFFSPLPMLVPFFSFYMCVSLACPFFFLVFFFSWLLKHVPVLFIFGTKM